MTMVKMTSKRRNKKKMMKMFVESRNPNAEEEDDLLGGDTLCGRQVGRDGIVNDEDDDNDEDDVSGDEAHYNTVLRQLPDRGLKIDRRG